VKIFEGPERVDQKLKNEGEFGSRNFNRFVLRSFHYPKKGYLPCNDELNKSHSNFQQNPGGVKFELPLLSGMYPER